MFYHKYEYRTIQSDRSLTAVISNFKNIMLKIFLGALSNRTHLIIYEREKKQKE